MVSILIRFVPKIFLGVLLLFLVYKIYFIVFDSFSIFYLTKIKKVIDKKDFNNRIIDILLNFDSDVTDLQYENQIEFFDILLENKQSFLEYIKNGDKLDKLIGKIYLVSVILKIHNPLNLSERVQFVKLLNKNTKAELNKNLSWFYILQKELLNSKSKVNSHFLKYPLNDKYFYEVLDFYWFYMNLTR